MSPAGVIDLVSLLSPHEQGFWQGGYGLFSIQERVSYMGGDMTISSAPNQGARIVLRVPLGDLRLGTDDTSRTESLS